MKSRHYDKVIITCEHGGSEIPAEYTALFQEQQELLASYRGYDPGALEHARLLSEVLEAPLHFTENSRTLVDCNRSPDNREELFTEVTGSLDDDTKDAIMRDYYWPYRNPVEDRISQWIAEGHSVLHLSIHSFTHVYKGEVRPTDIGLLYDPDRYEEVAFCESWREGLAHQAPGIRIDMNEPYAGIDDGFTSYLRKHHPLSRYVGIELEFNRDWIIGNRKERWNWLQEINRVALLQLIG